MPPSIPTHRTRRSRLQRLKKEWKGAFYPKPFGDAKMLGYYAERLGAVEIYNTFYRLPKASVLENWAQQVPEGFRFVIKASRRITHFKRMKDAEDDFVETTMRTPTWKTGPRVWRRRNGSKRSSSSSTNRTPRGPKWR